MGSRHCVGCGHRASAHARFCERCGAALTWAARPLRAPRALEARILEERAAIEGERKQVTVMYTDIVGSMELTHALAAERWGFILDRFLAMAAASVHAFEGTVNQFTGDGLLAVFGAPLAHEDHARRACLAVLELQHEVAGLAAELVRTDGVAFAVRCGLNSGEVVVGAIGDDVHMDFVPLGNTTALGKRIESLAPVGSTAISASTAALVEGEFEVRELGDFAIKGVPGPQRVLELIGPGAAQTRLQATAETRGLSQFVGRAVERAALESALEGALAGEGRAVAIVGDPGVGKSRLVHEFVGGCRARGIAVTSVAAVAHGRHVPLLPVLALYRTSFGIDALDAPELAREQIRTTMLALDPGFAKDLPLLFDFLGVPDPARPLRRISARERQARLLALFTRVVKARSRREVAVIVVEDLQWIDDASATLIDALVAAVPGTRTVMVTTARPEHEVVWAGDGPHAQIDLGPLDAGASTDLIDGLLGQDRSLDGLKAMITARTAGNPFFVEEIVQALAEDGDLTGVRGAYRLASELEGVTLPVTVQAGLAARIDRLPAREKALVQTMSVIGGAAVPQQLLRDVAGLGARDLGDALDALTRARCVVPGDAGGGPGYAFKHPLIQEVAYGSQLSEARAGAHRAVAAAIERIYADGLDERAALLAHHYEAAGDTLAAAGWHARAAAWAERTSLPESLRHWRRVRHLAGELDDAHAHERDALAVKARIGILSMVWRLGASPEETATVHAEAHGDAGGFLLDLHAAGTLMHSGREHEGLEGFLRAGSGTADPGQALTAATGVAYANWIAGSVREGVAALDGALALTGDDPRTGKGLHFTCPLAHAYGSRAQCLGYTGDLHGARRDSGRAIDLAREHDDAETESAAHASRALLEAEAGEVEAALHHAARGLAIAEPAENVIHVIACSTPAAVAEVRAGRYAAALARARWNLAKVREHGIGFYFEPLLLATVARSQLALGEGDAALASADKAVEIMEARGLATCALQAPIALAEVLLATHGAGADEQIQAVLERARRVAREGGALVFEPLIDRELTTLARLRGDDPVLAGRAPR